MPGKDVVSFDEADPADIERLGGKGASLVEMSRLGLAVPPGFIISTDVCRAFLHERRIPDGIESAVDRHLVQIERALGRRLGDGEAPLLVSVRSGAPVSMPGMMDTILNLGLCEATVDGLARATYDEAFARDCYVRLLHAYGVTVRGIAATTLNASSDVAELIAIIAAESGTPFPQDPRVQLSEAIAAVFSSWESPRAIRYRRYAGIDDGLGTAVVVQAMVFGNLASRSGTGVAFTRDPATGDPAPYGDFLAGAQGEDVVAGEHEVDSLDECRTLAPDAYDELIDALGALERRHRDMCEIEFTLEEGRLWILQSRVGQRTGGAAVRIAMDMIDEGLIDAAEAVQRIHPAAMIHVRAAVLDPVAPRELLGSGVAASPGAAVGRVALTPIRAEEMAADGSDVILVRPFTSPDDVAGMIAARGIVTAHGGRTSHAAVVARGMDRPAVCGVRALTVTDAVARFDSVSVSEGDAISIDGSAGAVYRGALPRVEPATDPRVQTLLAACDALRRIPVLSEGAEAAWSDGAHTASDSIVVRNRDELDRAAVDIGAGRPVIIELTEDEGAQAFLGAAVGSATVGPLFVRIDRSWPAAARRLPPGPWSAIIATDAGSWAARVLAATVEPAP
ncbi:MAG: pyruvate, phosphate dikinase [Actinomycetota bacterium]